VRDRKERRRGSHHQAAEGLEQALPNPLRALQQFLIFWGPIKHNNNWQVPERNE
jgi:hypothetical protein